MADYLRCRSPALPTHRLACYSVAPSGAGTHPGLLAQLLLSVTSLRQHNRRVPIVIFDFGALPPNLRRDLQRLGAIVRPRGSYEACLAQMTPHWQTLGLYPVLHKLLNFRQIAAFRPQQVLQLDCDTVFLGDIDRVFCRYRDAHCYAREEPGCARSSTGVDPNCVDERCLQNVSAAEGANFIAPFNIGVMLFNEPLIRGASRIERLLLSYAWRFLLWIATHPERLWPGCLSFRPIAFLRRHAQLVGPADLRLALPYPSRNWWILDQVSLWSAFGHLRGLRCGDFAATDVVQGGEFLSNGSAVDHAVLCHYFSSNMNRFRQWIAASVPGRDRRDCSGSRERRAGLAGCQSASRVPSTWRRSDQ